MGVEVMAVVVMDGSDGCCSDGCGCSDNYSTV
jgi:hypothetical protein